MLLIIAGVDWTYVVGPVRTGAAKVGATEVAISEISGGVLVATAPGSPSSTVDEFARRSGAAAAINGGLFDGRERPMGPSLGGGLRWPLAKRQASSGVIGGGGGRVEIRDAPEAWMTDAVSGYPLLVRGGKALRVTCRDPLCSGRARRSAAGIAPGRIWLLAAEEPGLTLAELAQLLVELGAQDALNLDGGGSTALWAAGKTLVRGKIAVPNHLGVVVKNFSARPKTRDADLPLVPK